MIHYGLGALPPHRILEPRRAALTSIRILEGSQHQINTAFNIEGNDAKLAQFLLVLARVATGKDTWKRACRRNFPCFKCTDRLPMYHCSARRLLEAVPRGSLRVSHYNDSVTTAPLVLFLSSLLLSVCCWNSVAESHCGAVGIGSAT